MASRNMQVCAAPSCDKWSSDTTSGEDEELVGPSWETPLSPGIHSMDNFPLEQSRDDALRSAFDQVMRIDGQMVRPEAALTFPHFVLSRERLHCVSHNTCTQEEHTQLLVPRSCGEIFFQAPHCNPMAIHIGYEKTLDRILA